MGIEKAAPAARDRESVLDIGKISKEYKAESPTRKFEGKWRLFIRWFCIAVALYHLYAGGFRMPAAMVIRPIHLGLVLFLVFMLYPANRRSPLKRPSIPDMILATISLGGTFFLAFNYPAIALRGGMATTTDLIIGFFVCIILIEGARRVVGWALPILSLIFIAYLFVGPYMPSMLRHGGFSVARVIDHYWMYTEGIFGLALGVAATYVILFVLFGAFLNRSGTTELFASFALSLAGHSPGGPAKVGVIASGMMGTIQGSSAANVAATGMFTIPLMKSVGFPPHFAAAVEAVASCGGQFLPPVMGASAFIMAEYLGMPYVYVAAGALLPAIIYYGAVYLQVHLHSVRTGLTGVDRSRLPLMKEVLRQRGHMFLPLVVLIGMLINGYTPLYSAFFSIIAVVVVSQLKKETRMSLAAILDALEEGTKSALSTSTACAVVGFVVGSVGISGLGMIITHNLVHLGAGNLLLTLAIAAFASLILSMGLPTTSVYIITATLVAPALVRLGLAPLVAHLFCYYWGGVSAITPPVALAVYVGAGIAGADILKSGWAAMKLGIAAYVVPFFFVYRPSLVMREGQPIHMLAYSLLLGFVAVFIMGILSERFVYVRLPLYKAFILIGAFLLLFQRSMTTDLIGTGIFLLVLASQWMAAKKGTGGHLPSP